MKPFQRAHIPQSEVDIMVRDYTKAWEEGNAELRKAFPCSTLEEAKEKIRCHAIFATVDPVYANDKYQVVVREVKCEWGDMLHLSIKRLDREPIHDWRDLQEIKNQLVGPEHEGVELYPAEGRRVDTSNQYHLWVLKEKGLWFPFGFDERLVTEGSISKSKQRPL